eukprot:gene3433-6082_t
MKNYLRFVQYKTKFNYSKNQHRIVELRKLIQKYNHQYYNLSQSLIPDEEYDNLFSELKKLEQEIYSDTSLTDQIGADSTENRVKHDTKMLSLENCYTFEELIKFDRKIKNYENEFGIDEFEKYICEKKFDGIAVSLIYKDNKLIECVTRGNGMYGMNITNNMKKYCSNLNLNLNIDSMIVRGEVIIEKDEFNKIKSKKYSNLRNIVSGLLLSNFKQQENDEIKLKFIAYSIIENDKIKTQKEVLHLLKENNFDIDDKFKICSNINEIISFIKSIEKDNLNYQIDGMVIKLNNLNLQNLIGNTSRYPKHSIAYKFKSNFKYSILRNIIYQVSKNGKITPIAEFDPIKLNGVEIKRSTLFNFNFIKKNNFKLNSKIKIERVGDVIPKISSVPFEQEESDQDIELPILCPCSKRSILIKDEKNNLFCGLKNECHEILTFKFLNFCKVLEMKGLSKETIRELIKLNLITKFKDLFNLKENDLKNLKGFKEKRINNLLNSIKIGKRNLNFQNILMIILIKLKILMVLVKLNQ